MVTLNAKKILTLPDGLHSDGGGLYFRRRGDSALWIFRYQHGGKRRTVSIGVFPTVTLAQARDKAIDMARALQKGESPRTALPAPVAARTLGEAAEDFITHTAPSWKSKTEEKHTRNQLRDHFGKFYSTPLGHITQEDIIAVLRPVWKQSSVAEKLLSRIRRVFLREQALKHIQRQPIEWSAIRLIMPTAKKTVTHHPAFHWKEAPAAWQALAPHKGSAAACLRLIILCATRSGETRGAEWREFDLEKGLWTIPKDRTKTSKPLVVPLSRQAVNLIRSIPHLDPVHVFASRIAGKHISDMSVLKVQRYLHAKNDVHGWRSCFRDWGSENQHDPVLMEMQLNHNVGSGVERAYARANLAELRRPILQSWADFVTGEVTP